MADELSEREDAFNMAKLSESLNRSEDVLVYLHAVAMMTDGKLTSEEKKMLCKAYTKILSPRFDAVFDLTDMTAKVDAHKREMLEGYKKRIKEEIYSAREALMKTLKYLVPMPHVTDSEYSMDLVDDDVDIPEFEFQKPLIGQLIYIPIHRLSVIKRLFDSKLKCPKKMFEKFLEEAGAGFDSRLKTEAKELFEENLAIVSSAVPKVNEVFEELLLTAGKINKIRIRLIWGRRFKKRVLVARTARTKAMVSRRKRTVVSKSDGAEIQAERMQKVVFKLAISLKKLVNRLSGFNLGRGSLLKVSSCFDVWYAGSMARELGFKVQLQIAAKSVSVKAAYLIAVALEEGYNLEDLLVSY